MPIPRNITKQHIISALPEIEKIGVPQDKGSRNKLMIHQGKGYPPKYVISQANKYANGEPLSPANFTTQEAVTYLRKLGFKIMEKFSPSKFDTRVYHIFEQFGNLVEIRFKRIFEGHSELKHIYQESEDSIRYALFQVLTTTGGVNPTDVYLEFPHSQIPNRRYAKLDAFATLGEGEPALAFEFKFHKRIGNNVVPRPDNAGAVFADILRLALFRREQDNLKRYLIYVTDEHMIKYLINPTHGYEPFISLEENTGFKLTREYLAGKPVTFIKQLKKVTGRENFPEPIVICRFRKDLEFRRSIRVYEVIP